MRFVMQPPIVIMGYHRPGGATFPMTIASLLLADDTALGHDLHLVLDSPDLGVAWALRHLMHVHLLTAHQAAQQHPRTGATRTMLGWRRALDFTHEEGLILLEDDLTFSTNWLRQLKMAIARTNSESIVFAYWQPQGTQAALPPGDLPTIDGSHRADCTLAIYLPKIIADALKNELDARNFDEVIDYNWNLPFAGASLLANWVRWHGITVRVMQPTVVQHLNAEHGLHAHHGIRASTTFDETPHGRTKELV